MTNKILIVTTLLVAFLFFATSYTFAANNMGSDMVNGVRNVVGGAENAIEDAGRGIVNGVRSGTNTVENGAENATNGMRNGMDNMTNDTNTNGDTTNNTDTNATTGNMDNGYTATRTTGDTTGTGLFGNISESVWTWLIVGVAGIAIVSLVMFYGKQHSVTTYRNDDDEE